MMRRLFLKAEFTRLYQKSLLWNRLQRNRFTAKPSCKNLIAGADGDYSFLMIKDGWIGAGRDPVGVQPLYFGENHDIAAVATNQKALWKLGNREPRFFSAWKHGFCEP